MDEYFVQEKSSWDRLLDFLVFIAVFVVTIFLILEILAPGVQSLDVQKINNIYFYVNIVVFIVFVVDIIRLWKESTSAGEFFKNSWLDVLATIPFALIIGLLGGVAGPKFEVLKLIRLNKLAAIGKVQKVSRGAKITKEFKAAAHLKKEGEEYQRKHRL
jgi:magnesium-transporting ATPase (P-type)